MWLREAEGAQLGTVASRVGNLAHFNMDNTKFSLTSGGSDQSRGLSLSVPSQFSHWLHPILRPNIILGRTALIGGLQSKRMNNP